MPTLWPGRPAERPNKSLTVTKLAPKKPIWYNAGMGIQIVDDTRFGVYLWMLPDGTFLNDGSGNFLSLNGERGDIIKMNKMARAAKSYGYPDGRAVFYADRRKVTDEEYAEQKRRLIDGYVPDPEWDYGSIRDDEAGRRG